MPIISVPGSTPTPPLPPATTQPLGVPLASTHYLSPFCTPEDIPAGLITDSSGNLITDVPVGLAICAATEVLFNKTRSQFRSGRSIIRPSQVVNTFGAQSYLYPYSSMAGYGSAWGFGDGWGWSSMGLGWWQNGMDLSEITLQAPVTRINSVIVNGVELDPATDYALYDRRRLVLLIGQGAAGVAWPWNQSIQLPADQPGTCQIDYEWGKTPDAMGKVATAELASEIIRSLSGQDNAKLPARITTVATQGVNVAVGDAIEYLKEGLTGLPLCDMWIMAVNPTRSRHRARFISPNTVLNRET